MLTQHQQFVGFVKERLAVYQRRALGLPAPWTEDEILQKYRFCNIERECDRTTVWIREHLREPVSDSPLLVVLMVIARLINRIETLSALKDGIVLDGWNAERDVAKLRTVALNAPITGSAYMVTTPEGMDKAAGISFMVECVQQDLAFRRRFRTLYELHERLMIHPRLGSFLAAQVVADVKYSSSYRSVEDWWTFAASGPGSRRGLNRLLGRLPNAPWKEQEWRTQLARVHAAIAPALCGVPRLHAQDFQNCLCEFDKYERVRLGEGAPKQLYKPQSNKRQESLL